MQLLRLRGRVLLLDSFNITRLVLRPGLQWHALLRARRHATVHATATIAADDDGSGSIPPGKSACHFSSSYPASLLSGGSCTKWDLRA